MKIRSLSITNFRAYKNTTQIFFDDLTVFVGKNDVGKSTILEALDIFFHDGKDLIKYDKADLNIQESRVGNENTIISVVFDDLPEQVVIDATSNTTLKDEYLFNADGLLEVVKKFHSGSSTKIFIRALHPTNPQCSDLLLKKNSELKSILKNNDIFCENQSSNVSIRRAIWEHYSDDLGLQLIDIDVSKEDVKKIWGNISAYLPVYSLFQSDRKNSDGDSEVQDPLQEAVKQIINDSALKNSLAEIANIVMSKLNEVSDRTLSKLREMNPDIASSLTPVIPSVESLKWSDVFKKVSISGDDGIPINKRGSGVKRLVLLNFFRAEAERRVEERSEELGNTGVIYAIEEPETSQHAENQRTLIQSLKRLSNLPHTQVILTTHSGFIVKELSFESLRLIDDIDGEKKVLNVDSKVLTYPSLNEVNFLAFDEVTEEYHNELYGFIDERGWLNDYEKGKKLVTYNQIQSNNKGTGYKTLQITQSRYIRNQIHHPENKYNIRFTFQELRDSIEDMRRYIQNRLGED